MDPDDSLAGESVCSFPGCTARLDDHAQESHDEEIAAARGLGAAIVLALIFVIAAAVGLIAWAVVIEPALDRAGW